MATPDPAPLALDARVERMEADPLERLAPHTEPLDADTGAQEDLT